MKKVLCLDAGHYSGSANGNAEFGYKEDEFALDISKRMQELLEPYITVVQTRLDGSYVSLNKRVNIANKSNADIFVSLHTNAGSSKSASGYEWWVYEKKGEALRLAQEFEKFSIPFLSTVSRGIKAGNFTVIAQTKMPAVLIEHGFHTNDTDVSLLLDSNYRDKVAYANAKAILSYFNIQNKLSYKESSQENSQEDPNNESIKNIPSSWAKQAWDWGISKGLTDGNNPHAMASREQVMTFLYRLFEEKK